MIRKRKTERVEDVHETTSSESDDNIQQFTASFVKSVAKPNKSESKRKKTETVNKRRKSQPVETSATEAQHNSSRSSEVDSSSEEEAETKTKRNVRGKPQITHRQKSVTVEQIEPASDSESGDEDGDEDGDGDEEAMDDPSRSRTGEDIDEEDEQMDSGQEECNVETGAVSISK